MIFSGRYPPAVQRAISDLVRSECGSTAVEYALIGSFIGAVLAGSVFVLSDHVLALFESVAALLPS